MSSTASLPIPAKMRLTRELSLFSKSPPPGISCYTPNDTLTHLHAQITGKNSFLFVCGIKLVGLFTIIPVLIEVMALKLYNFASDGGGKFHNPF